MTEAERKDLLEAVFCLACGYCRRGSVPKLVDQVAGFWHQEIKPETRHERFFTLGTGGVPCGANKLRLGMMARRT